MSDIKMSPEQIAKVTTRLGRELTEWLRDHVVEQQYSIETTAELLEVTPRTVVNYVELGATTQGARGIYPVVKLSHKVVRIPASSINRMLKACTIAAPAAAGQLQETAA